MNVNSLLQEKNCTCGKRHGCSIQAVYVEADAAAHLPQICGDCKKLLLVADENTYRVAGERTERHLSGYTCVRQIFPASPLLVPNEAAVDAVTKKLTGCDMIVGIGSGVIQDLCKYVSHLSGVPYCIVATAPSMDGYASSAAAMIMGGMKTTFAVGLPRAILADTEVLREAPMEMICAGYGDIVGKYSALNDWRLSAVVNGEHFCPLVYDMTFEMLRATVPLAKGLLARDEASVKALTEALIGVGIAMSYEGNSRPASGSEHHLSHFFEITGILFDRPYLPHGIDVAFSTVLTARMRQKLLQAPFPRKQFVMGAEEYNAEMKRVYGSLAQSCADLQNTVGNYQSTARFAQYLAHEEEIRAILSQMPSPQEITDLLAAVGLDTATFDATYSQQTIADALCYAKDLKDRYTVLWLYYDLYGTQPLV